MPPFPNFIIAPQYGPQGFAGGTRMETVLGPNQGLMYLGSPTSVASIPGIMGPLHRRNPGKWIAGHLLNGELGGNGTYTPNLTPLTENANKRHSGYELKVKRLCIKCRQYMEMRKITAYYLGVRYQVIVSPIRFGDFPPYNAVASHITISARAYRYDAHGNQFDLSIEEANHLQADFFNNVEIHNHDDDLR